MYYPQKTNPSFLKPLCSGSKILFSSSLQIMWVLQRAISALINISELHRQTGCIFCPPPSVPHANVVFFFLFLSASETWCKRATEEVAEIVFTHAKHVLITDRSLLWVWGRAEASYRHESRGDVTSPHCARTMHQLGLWGSEENMVKNV